MATRFQAKQFPASQQLSLQGLELCYVEYEKVKEYVLALAHKRLRRALKPEDSGLLAWHKATAIADSDLLSTLHAYGKVQCWKEAPPWVVLVR